MAISVDWSNRIINVPKANLTLKQETPTEIRELNLDTFRLALKALEDDEAGIVFPDTHVHIPPYSFGGITYARFVVIINGYTVTFEDGQYVVNLVGANSNLMDMLNTNNVSVRGNNSAGLISSPLIESLLPSIENDVNTIESNVDNMKNNVDEIKNNVDSIKNNVDEMMLYKEGRWKIDKTTKQMIFYSADGETILKTFNLYDENEEPSYDRVFERRPA